MYTVVLNIHWGGKKSSKPSDNYPSNWSSKSMALTDLWRVVSAILYGWNCSALKVTKRTRKFSHLCLVLNKDFFKCSLLLSSTKHINAEDVTIQTSEMGAGNQTKNFHIHLENDADFLKMLFVMTIKEWRNVWSKGTFRRQFCKMAAQPILCLCFLWQFISHQWNRSNEFSEQAVWNQKRCGKQNSAALTCYCTQAADESNRIRRTAFASYNVAEIEVCPVHPAATTSTVVVIYLVEFSF